MSIFDLDEQSDSAIADQARATGVTADEVQPGFFDGGLRGTGMGLARGFSKLARAGALAIGGGLGVAEKLGGYDPGEITDSYYDSVVRLTDESVEFFTPRANEVGTAGRVLGGLAEIVAPLALTGGNPAALIGSTGLNITYELAKQGVDPTTAVGVGLVDATAVGIGFRLPFLGSTFLQKAATGAAGSVALGIGATAADRAILDARGYQELAQQYNPLDIEARTVDLLTGIAFGGIAQLQSGRAIETVRSERDAALAGLNARHFQSEAAPGRPADEIALSAHQRALETAIRQLQEGRPVDVGESRVTEARFIEGPRETPSARDSRVREVLDELGIRDPEPARTETPVVAPDAIVDTQAAIGDARIGTADLPPGRTVTPDTSPPTPVRRSERAAEPAAREPAAPREADRAEVDDPDVIAAERAVADRDTMIDTGEIDAQGVAKAVSAREALAAAREEVSKAKRESTAFEAAVACALSFGEA